MEKQCKNIRAQESEETGQTLISGMGELVVEPLAAQFQVECARSQAAHAATARRCKNQSKPPASFTRPWPDRHCCQGAASRRSVDGDVPVITASGDRPWARTRRPGAAGEGGGSLGYAAAHEGKDHGRGGRGTRSETTWRSRRGPAADAFSEADGRRRRCAPQRGGKWLYRTVGDFVADLGGPRAIITHTHCPRWKRVVEGRGSAGGVGRLFGGGGLSQGRASASLSPSHYGPARQEVLQSFM